MYPKSVNGSLMKETVTQIKSGITISFGGRVKMYIFHLSFY